MKAQTLYDKLNADFIKDGIRDIDWAARMPELDRYLSAEFKQNGGMGLMCDFAQDIEKVYTTVFLSEKVLSYILEQPVSNALLFSHHPSNWDIKDHNGTYAADEKMIAKLKERNISIYILHHPLDNYGHYSTCKTLADQLNLTIEKPGFLYYGAFCGVVGTCSCGTAHELQEMYTNAVGHPTSLYLYGSEYIQGQKIAVCPGGGNVAFVINEMLQKGIKILITGISVVNDHSHSAHRLLEENKMNLLGGTHYSSEKFAPMKMCQYFTALGLPAEFVTDQPSLYDL